MTLIAGIDIGNSTTEIVVCDGDVPIAWDRRPTRGVKGSSASVQAAAALLKNIERVHKLTVDHVVVAPWKPVTTATRTVHEPAPDTGNIQLVHCAHHSVFGDAAVAGTPWLITDPTPSHDVIAIVPRTTTFTEAAAILNDSSHVIGVLVERDEAVLISARINTALPIIDGVDIEHALSASRIFMEVRPAGRQVTTATDVWAVAHALSVTEDHHDVLALLAHWVRNERTVVIAMSDKVRTPREQNISDTVLWRDGRTQDVFSAIDSLPSKPTHSIDALNDSPVDDLWAIDLVATINRTNVTTSVNAAQHSRIIALASLAEDDQEVINVQDFFSAPVSVATSEAAAAERGARTTPGIPDDAVILDIGGGTIDLITPTGETSVAGAGELLTSAVATVLDVPRGAADWIKRGPASRVDAPQVLMNEDGSKTFTSESISGNLVGWLITSGPSGYLPFGKTMQTAEWRILRQAFKVDALANNVARLLSDSHDLNVIVVGGPAADDELIPALATLPSIRAIGRGNVAGTLGHRYAVAYGLTQMFTSSH